jgi:hypothetical protein
MRTPLIKFQKDTSAVDVSKKRPGLTPKFD